MSVTLFGEKAEKLIGFSAVELNASVEKHWTFEKEIEARVHKKPITCFVKCYDKTFQGNNVRAHTIVHMYSLAQPSTGTDETAQTLLLKGDSSKAMANVETSASEQLFSPTTKKVLEEISAKTVLAQPSSLLIETTKRPLFGTKEDVETAEASMQAVDVDNPSKTDIDGVDKFTDRDENKASASSV